MDEDTVEDKKSDAYILSGSPVTITLFGEEYKFIARPMRDAREVRVRLFAITAQIVDAEICTPMERAGKIMEAARLIQNLFEDLCHEFKMDAKDIEIELMSKGVDGYQEVIDCYAPLANAWLSPYLGANVAKKKRPRKTQKQKKK